MSTKESGRVCLPASDTHGRGSASASSGSSKKGAQRHRWINPVPIYPLNSHVPIRAAGRQPPARGKFCLAYCYTRCMAGSREGSHHVMYACISTLHQSDAGQRLYCALLCSMCARDVASSLSRHNSSSSKYSTNLTLYAALCCGSIHTRRGYSQSRVVGRGVGGGEAIKRSQVQQHYCEYACVCVCV